MLHQHQRLVEDGVFVRGRIESSAMKLVRIVTNADVMPDPNGRIIRQPPSSTPQREAERHLPVHLGASTT